MLTLFPNLFLNLTALGDNMDELNSQKKKMNEREKVMKTSVMTSVGTIFWIILMFVVTYAIMRLFPKPRSL